MNQIFEKIKQISANIKVEIIENVEEFIKNNPQFIDLKPEDFEFKFNNYTYSINSFPNISSLVITLLIENENFKKTISDYLKSKKPKSDKIIYLKNLKFELDQIYQNYYSTTYPFNDLPIQYITNKLFTYPLEFEYESTGYIDCEVFYQTSKFCEIIQEKLTKILQWLEHEIYITNDIPEIFIKKKNQPNVPVTALIYYYKIEAKEIWAFNQYENMSMLKAMEFVLKNDGYSCGVNNFKNIYYAIGKDTKKDPLKKKYLEIAIKKLTGKALENAKKDLDDIIKYDS